MNEVRVNHSAVATQKNGKRYVVPVYAIDDPEYDFHHGAVNFKDKYDRKVGMRNDEAFTYSGICKYGSRQMLECYKNLDKIVTRYEIADRCRACWNCLLTDEYYNIWQPGFIECVTNGVCSQYLAESFVYFISDGSAVKIGTASNVVSRLAQLQTGNPNKLEVIAQIPFEYSNYARSAEKSLHEIYSNFATTGEWFKILGLIDVEAFKKKYPPITEGENE